MAEYVVFEVEMSSTGPHLAIVEINIFEAIFLILKHVFQNIENVNKKFYI